MRKIVVMEPQHIFLMQDEICGFCMIQVKCQRCWKVFEASEESIGKTKTCLFCKKETIIKPFEDTPAEEKPTENWMKTQGTNILLGVLIVINFLYILIMTVVSQKQLSESIFLDTFHPTVEWQAKVDKQMEILQREIQAVKESTQKLSQAIDKSRIEIIANFVGAIENSSTNMEQYSLKIDALHTSISSLQIKLDQLQKEVAKSSTNDPKTIPSPKKP